MRNNIALLLIAMMTMACGKSPEIEPLAAESYKAVILKGNSWISVTEKDGSVDYRDVDQSIRLDDGRYSANTYFYALEKCTLSFRIEASGKGSLLIKLDDQEKELQLSEEQQEYFVYDLSIGEKGYKALNVSAGENSVAEIKSISIGHREGKNCFKSVESDFYWGRRGPSVHLNYRMPEAVKAAQWMYSELTIPENNDVLGTYFMANGFAEGYFGMQVNSQSERRILFSVWSPYRTDNPNEIPEDQRIRLAKKGPDVQVKDFGNEGSGGQSFLRYNWEAGKAYAFLLKVVPLGNDETQYTAWFADREKGDFRLIASFIRPKTDTYLKRPHAFLENFYTQMGAVSRMGHYHNQWIAEGDGEWHAIKQALFSADATARKENRLDFAGGDDANGFFLKNCGFFSPNTEIGRPLENKASYRLPEVDLTNLP